MRVSIPLKPCKWCLEKSVEIARLEIALRELYAENERLRRESADYETRAMLAEHDRDDARGTRDRLGAEVARLQELASSVVSGIDDWNKSVEKIIGRRVDYQWGALEALRAALAAKEG